MVNSNIDDFRYHYSLAKNWHEFAISDSKLKLETNLQDILIRFETYYVAQMLLYMCAALNSVRKSNESIDLPMLPAVLEIVEKRKLDETEPLIGCYKAIVLLLQTQKQQYFDELLLILGNDVLQLEKAELSGIYTIAINYCIRRYNQGNVVFGEYVLDLYTEMLESDCLISNHYLEYMHFKNILFVALALKKHTWAKAFVVKYESRLNPDIRSDMKCYGEGLIAFREGKYEEAQLSFLQINNFNFVFHLNKEIYLLKIFYMSNGLLLESKLETLRSYLRQNKQLTAKTRKEYEFFYKKLKQLYRIKEQYDFLKNNPAKLEKVKKAAEKLLASIENERGVIVQGLWFRKQVEELLNKM